MPAKITLRFNFTDDIMELITTFAKYHQFDDRHTYKDNWAKWFEKNKSVLLNEIDRLTTNGYKGDIKDKMYKAGRYYFRKKNNASVNNTTVNNASAVNNATVNNATVNNASDKVHKKRTYITMDKQIIEEMDKHIITSIRAQESNALQYTPAKGYEEFCKLFSNLLNREKIRLHIEYKIDNDTVSDKIKKNYKNRYFITTLFKKTLL